MGKDELRTLKLLYVEDEVNIRKYAMSYFNRLFQTTFEAKNVKEAIKIYEKEKPHIIITDIKMNKATGIDLIKEIRKKDKVCQIIVLSAFLDTKYLLEAISLNLVKYLTKPLKHDELYLALLECSKNLSELHSKLYFSNNCFFNSFDKTLINENVNVKMTSKELQFLELLIANKNRITSYEEIENKIWFDSVMSENALRLLVKKLRKKLPPNALENTARLGYKLVFKS